MTNARRTLLIVDAECAALKELAARFAPGRFRIATCPRWDVALEYVAQNRPDFVLTEAKTFYLDGPSLLREIRKVSPGTRVIFLDTEDAWSLFMEPSGGDGSVTIINPCRREELLKGAMEAVDTQPPKPRREEETWA
jgi:DNA-binding response OmpR family regulator